MLFAIKYEAMNGSEIVLNLLDALLSRAEDDIHELEIVDADVLESSAWYESCRSDRRKMLEKSAESLLHRSPRIRGPHLRRIEVTDESTAARARSLAYTPLYVLVENRESDGALVKTALKIFTTPTVWDLCFGSGALRSPQALSIESGGGHGELKKLLAELLKGAADRGLEPRIIVITDSDGEWIGDVKEHASEIRAQCAAEGVPCPSLNKRKAENYIPDAVWQAWADELQQTNARPAVAALLRLSVHQRDHVNMDKKGIDPWDSSKPDAVSLFVGVSAGDRDLLKRASLKGRGSNAIATMLETHISALTRAQFQTRDHAGDLEAMVRFIEDGL